MLILSASTPSEGTGAEIRGLFVAAMERFDLAMKGAQSIDAEVTFKSEISKS